MNKELSIIIVNYNGKTFLKNCINSIKKVCNNINYEIIIVDNASQDDSVSFLENNFKSDIVLIKSNYNLGFAKGNNLGVRHSKGKFILLLNNDTVLKNNLKPVLEQFNDEKIGIVGIKMLGKNKEYRFSAGNFPSPIRLLKLSKLYNQTLEFKSGEFDESKKYEVDWIEGSFLMTRKDIWNLVKGLDESYFMYVEDIDFCKKVNMNNYKIVYLPSIKYIHFGGYGVSREKMLKKGLNIYLNKYFKTPKRQLGLLSVFINFAIKDVKKIVRKTS